MWIACGVVAWTSAWLRRYHQPDIIGFNALLIPPLLWTIFYCWSLFAAVISGGAYGRYASVVGIIVWTATLVTIVVTAGWPDPDSPTHRKGQR
jgi:hypothetical protein